MRCVRGTRREVDEKRSDFSDCIQAIAWLVMSVKL
jgi:hypothetical protein